MAHEELKRQWEEDVKKYGRTKAIHMWEFKLKSGEDDWSSLFKAPEFNSYCEYRRKEPLFEPQYYSGLNWRDAEHLIGKMVEFSFTGDSWAKGTLSEVVRKKHEQFRYKEKDNTRAIYIRTCPETHAHPTITLTVNGREWVLPKPETEAPERGIDYWIVDTCETDIYKWQDGEVDREWLEAGIVHLTGSCAQAWADFWNEAILGAIKNGQS